MSDDPVYARLGYSTHTSPELPQDPAGGPVDSTVTLVDAEGRAAHRRPLRRIGVEGPVGVSRSRAHWPENEEWDPFGGPDTPQRTGPWITVASVLRGAMEIRLVRVDPGPDDDHPGPWRLRIGGWALADAEAGAENGDRLSATAHRPGLFSTVVGLAGFAHAKLYGSRGSTPLGSTSLTPVLLTSGPPDPGRLYAAAVRLSGAPFEVAEVPAVTSRSADGDIWVTVVWPGGEANTVVLPAPGFPTVAG